MSKRQTKKKIRYKIPQESPDYPEQSAYVLERISQIMQQAIETGKNRIFIHTNLKRGPPLENINKVAGPFVEAIRSKNKASWLKLARRNQWIKERE